MRYSKDIPNIANVQMAIHQKKPSQRRSKEGNSKPEMDVAFFKLFEDDVGRSWNYCGEEHEERRRRTKQEEKRPLQVEREYCEEMEGEDCGECY